MPTYALFEVDYVLGLGSNLGSRWASIDAGLGLLAATPGCRVVAVSSFYDNEPVGPPQPRYLNAAARVHSELPPLALLDRLLEIEALLGRQRRERWGARTLDLDILWAPRAMSDARLSIPHARLGERWFALAPLLEVAPELSVDGGTYAAQLSRLPVPDLASARVVLPVAEVAARGAGLHVSAGARDLPDAVAAALGALGRELTGKNPCRKTEAQVLLGSTVPGEELQALVQQTLAWIGRGFAVAHVTLCELSEGRFDARLVGEARVLDVPAGRIASPALVTRVESVVTPGAARVEFALGG
jgi:2-amino-4-hydroxy-6-hydroxymethyldihydropteridine diphosphokinase